MKHRKNVVLCQVLMVSTIEEVSRGAQTSGLVRKTTVKTGHIQTPLLESSTNVAEVWRISPLVSLPPSLRVAVSLTRSQHLPHVLLPIDADPRSPPGHEHRSLGPLALYSRSH